jgi:uncharacterized protein with HEPN domain
MQRDLRAYLWDVRQSAFAIQTFTAGMDAEAYAASELVQAAVERKFEIIGEALNQFAKQDAARAVRIPELPQVVAFRNQLIHGYAAVDVGTVWNVLKQSLPPLLAHIQTILDELGEI